MIFRAKREDYYARAIPCRLMMPGCRHFRRRHYDAAYCRRHYDMPMPPPPLAPCLLMSAAIIFRHAVHAIIINIDTPLLMLMSASATL